MTAYDQNKRFSQRFGPMLFSNGSLANYVQQIFKAFEIIGILNCSWKNEKNKYCEIEILRNETDFYRSF